MLTHGTSLITFVLSRRNSHKVRNRISLTMGQLFLSCSSTFAPQVFAGPRILLTSDYRLGKVQSSFSRTLRSVIFFGWQNTAVFSELFPDFPHYSPPSISQKTNRSQEVHYVTPLKVPGTAVYSMLAPVMQLRQRRHLGGMSRKWDNNKDEIWLEEIPEVLEETMGKILVKEYLFVWLQLG